MRVARNMCTRVVYYERSEYGNIFPRAQGNPEKGSPPPMGPSIRHRLADGLGRDARTTLAAWWDCSHARAWHQPGMQSGFYSFSDPWQWFGAVRLFAPPTIRYPPPRATAGKHFTEGIS
jgi:hypothetical protein